MNIAIKLIPEFAMYGDPPPEASKNFLHLESIESRSRLHDWTICAHRHANLNHIFWVTGGGGELLADHNRISYQAPALLLIPAREVHALHWQEESTGWLLTISDSYLDSLCVNRPNFRMLFEKVERITFGSKQHGLQNFELELAHLLDELGGTALHHYAAVEAQLTIILIELMRLVAIQSHHRQVSPTPHTRTVARFRALVEEHFRASLTLQAYADELQISPKRLRIACTKVTGSAPAQLIQERRLIEARRLLLYTTNTITEVAYHLGFCDPAYFSRAFRSRFGKSPREMRRHDFAESGPLPEERPCLAYCCEIGGPRDGKEETHG